MSKEFETKILLDSVDGGFEYGIGEEINGEVFIKPKLDLNLLEFGFVLNLEIRGKLETDRKEIYRKTLASNISLRQDEVYAYPIRFRNQNFETYQGKNVSFLISIETFLEKNKSSQSLFNPKNIANNFLSIFKEEDVKYINFYDQQQAYEISSPPIELKLKYFNFLFIYLPSIVALLTIFSLNFDYLMITIPLGILCLIGFAFFNVFYTQLGRINVAFENLGNKQFEVRINNDKNWKTINEVYSNYAIVEEVIDRRGTSSVVNTSEVFVSDKQEIRRPFGELKQIFHFLKFQPPTIDLGDVKIYWIFEVRIKNKFGIPFVFYHEFLVEKTNRFNFEKGNLFLQ